MKKTTEKRKSRIYMNLLAPTLLILSLSQRADSWLFLEPSSGSSPIASIVQVQNHANSYPGNQQTAQLSSNPAKQVAPSSALAEPSARPDSQADLTKQLPVSPSPAGKILDSVVSNTVAGIVESSLNSSSSKDDKSNPLRLFLRPRKSSASETQDIEQQIIRQHARLHHNFAPRKSFPPQALESNSDGRDFSSILGNLKSGISSRSSIVKAISDNKLARTLTDVGKTIGANKYIAGAAAASAIAALGLAVSKMITPYLYAGNYAKLSNEPLIDSGSLQQYTFAPYNPTDRTYVGSNYAPDQLFATSPTPNQYVSYQTLSPSNTNRYQDSFSSYPSGSMDYIDNAAQQTGTYQTNNPQSSQSASSPGYYFTYKPVDKISPEVSPPQVDLSPQQSQGSSEVGGYYGGFYDKLSQPNPIPATYTNQAFSPINGANVNYNSGLSVNGGQQPNDFVDSSDQMMASSSIASPSYIPGQLLANKQQQNLDSSSISGLRNPAPRRSGSVLLKLKEADEFKLAQRLRETQFREQYVHPIYFLETKNETTKAQKLAAINNDDKSNFERSGNSVQFVENYINNGHQIETNNNKFNFMKPKMNEPANQQVTKFVLLDKSNSNWRSVDSLETNRQVGSKANSVDHRDRMEAIDHSGGSEKLQQSSAQRVFRTQTSGSSGLVGDYRLSAEPTKKTHLSDKPAEASVSAISGNKPNVENSQDHSSTGEGSYDNDNNVVKLIKANTKSGKLTSGRHQEPKQQMSQLDEPRPEQITAGGLTIMSPPRQQQQQQVSQNEDNERQSDEADDKEAIDEGQRRGQSAETAGKSADDAGSNADSFPAKQN